MYNYDRQFRRAMSENPLRCWDRVDQLPKTTMLPQKRLGKQGQEGDAVAMCIRLGKEGYLAKSDLKSSFWQLPTMQMISTCSVSALMHYGFSMHACLSFQPCHCSQVFEKFSSALHWKVACIIQDVLIHYLDDFLMGGG